MNSKGVECTAGSAINVPDRINAVGVDKDESLQKLKEVNGFTGTWIA